MSKRRHSGQKRRHIRDEDLPPITRRLVKKLRKAQDFHYKEIEKRHREISKLIDKVAIQREKDDGKHIFIGRPGVKVESVQIGPVNLLQLEARVKHLERYALTGCR